MTGQPIEVYVELAGKEKYHQSLKGRDEANQHPIKAITNLEDNLNAINERIDINRDNISELSESTNNRFLNFETTLEATKEEITNETKEQIQELASSVQEQFDKIDLEEYYNKEDIDELMDGAFHYKGQVPDFESLPMYQNQKGDVYNVQKTGANFVWTGYAWDNLSPALCLKGYATKDYVDGTIETGVRLLRNYVQQSYYDKDTIDEKFDSIIHFDPAILENVFVYKGSETTLSRLPMRGNKIGDVYLITEDNSKWFWTGVDWELLAQDLTDKIYTKEEIEELLALKADKEDVYTKDVIDEKLQEINQIIEQGQQSITDIINGKIETVNQTIQELSEKHDRDTLNLARAIGDVSDHLETRVHEFDTRINILDEKVNTVNTELTQKIEDTEVRLTETIETTQNTLNNKIDDVEYNIEHQLIETQIELTTFKEETNNKIDSLEEGTTEELEEFEQETVERFTTLQADLDNFKEEVKNDPVKQWHNLGEED